MDCDTTDEARRERSNGNNVADQSRYLLLGNWTRAHLRLFKELVFHRKSIWFTTLSSPVQFAVQTTPTVQRDLLWSESIALVVHCLLHRGKQRQTLWGVEVL